MVEPRHPVYKDFLCLSLTGVADVRPGQRFHILITNFGEYESDVLPHNMVPYASQNSATNV